MRRILSVILAILCICLTLPVDGLGTGFEPLTLAVVLKYGETPLGGFRVTIWHVADLNIVTGGLFYTSTPEFSGLGADFTELTTQKNIQLAARLYAYVSTPAHPIPGEYGITDADGKVEFTKTASDALPAGLYLVALTGGSGYSVDPYLVALPGADDITGEWITDVVSRPKTEPRVVAQTISLSVFKIWEGLGSHPASVTVQLYQNGSPFGFPVTLNEGNQWSYRWLSLGAGYTWTVDEYPVPDGYTKVVSGDIRTGFVIRNIENETWESPLPSESVESPDIPIGPLPTPGLTPEVTTDSNTVETPRVPIAPPDSDDTPKTGDDGNLTLWLFFLGLSLLGLVALIASRIPRRRSFTPSPTAPKDSSRIPPW